MSKLLLSPQGIATMTLSPENISALETTGCCVFQFPQDSKLYLTAHSYLDHLVDTDGFQTAKIGRAETEQTNLEIRNDELYWLDANRENDHNLWQELATLGSQLKKEFRVALSAQEFFFARYSVGGRYHRHLDQHASSAARLFTLLIYFNENRSTSDGGLLKLTNLQSQNMEVLPTARVGVLFRSDLIEHEVTENHSPRLSLCGWYRQF